MACPNKYLSCAGCRSATSSPNRKTAPLPLVWPRLASLPCPPLPPLRPHLREWPMSVRLGRRCSRLRALQWHWVARAASTQPHPAGSQLALTQPWEPRRSCPSLPVPQRASPAARRDREACVPAPSNQVRLCQFFLARRTWLPERSAARSHCPCHPQMPRKTPY